MSTEQPSAPQPQAGPSLVRSLAARLGARAGRVPYVPQLAATECGAACLAMVLGYHGKDVGLAETRRVLSPGRDGTSALEILRAGRHFGLEGRGVRIELEELAQLPAGAILHWELQHFVVLQRTSKGEAWIVDPNGGPRWVSREELARAFTGIALILGPGPGFARADATPTRTSTAMWALIGQLHLARPILVLTLLLQLFLVIAPLGVGLLVDRVLPRRDFGTLGLLAAGAGLAAAFHGLGALVRAELLLQLRTIVDLRFTAGFVRHLLGLPLAYFQRRTAGDLLNRIGSTGLLRELLTGSLLGAILDGGIVLVLGVVLLIASPTLAAIVFGFVAIQSLIVLGTRRKRRERMAALLEAEARVSALQVEAVTAIETVKAAGLDEMIAERWGNRFVTVLNASLARGHVEAAVGAALSTLRLIAPITTLLVGGWLTLSGALPLGLMLALTALATEVYGPVGRMLDTWGRLEEIREVLARLDDVLAEPTEEQPGQRTPAARLRGAIAVEDVRLRWSPIAPWALDGVSLAIAPGELVAIVGRSGSGKSTLAAVLAGLIAPDQGRVTYDGVPLDALDLSSVRRQIGVVPQSTQLFAATIRDNIALAAPDRPIAAVVAAARRAALHDDIVAMPAGYDTLLADRGASLSGGQRQRLALARALLREPAILLLDEATSALDVMTEAAVQRELERLPCTRIVIAHRLSTIRRAHRIVVLDQGRIVAIGRHDELMAAGGLYHDLVGVA